MIAFLAPGAHYRSFFVGRFFLRREHFRKFWLVKLFVAVFKRAATRRSRHVDPFVRRQAHFCLISVVECHFTFCFQDPAFAVSMDGDSTSITAFSGRAASDFTVGLRFQIAAIVGRVAFGPQMCIWLGIALNFDYEVVFDAFYTVQIGRGSLVGLSWRSGETRDVSGYLPILSPVESRRLKKRIRNWYHRRFGFENVSGWEKRSFATKILISDAKLRYAFFY